MEKEKEGGMEKERENWKERERERVRAKDCMTPPPPMAGNHSPEFGAHEISSVSLLNATFRVSGFGFRVFGFQVYRFLWNLVPLRFPA